MSPQSDSDAITSPTHSPTDGAPVGDDGGGSEDSGGASTSLAQVSNQSEPDVKKSQSHAATITSSSQRSARVVRTQETINITTEVVLDKTSHHRNNEKCVGHDFIDLDEEAEIIDYGPREGTQRASLILSISSDPIISSSSTHHNKIKSSISSDESLTSSSGGSDVEPEQGGSGTMSGSGTGSTTSSSSANSSSQNSSNGPTSGTSVSTTALIQTTSSTTGLQQTRKLKSLLKWPHNKENATTTSSSTTTATMQNGDVKRVHSTSSTVASHKRRVTFSDTMMVFCDDWPPELMPQLISLKSPIVEITSHLTTSGGALVDFETFMFEPPLEYQDGRHHHHHGHHHHDSYGSGSMSQFEPPPDYRDFLAGTTTTLTTSLTSAINKSSSSSSSSSKSTSTTSSSNKSTAVLKSLNIGDIAFIDDSDSASSDLEFVVNSRKSSGHHNNHAYHQQQHGRHAYNPQQHHGSQQLNRNRNPQRAAPREAAIDVEKAAKLKDMIMTQTIEEDTILGVLRQDSLLQAIGMTVEDFRAEDFIKHAQKTIPAKPASSSASNKKSHKNEGTPAWEETSSSTSAETNSNSGDEVETSCDTAAAAKKRNKSTGPPVAAKPVKHTTTIQMKSNNSTSLSKESRTNSTSTATDAVKEKSSSLETTTSTETMTEDEERNAVLSPASSDTPSLREEIHSDASLTSQDTIILMTHAGPHALMAASTDSLATVASGSSSLIELPVTCSPKSVIYTLHTGHSQHHPPIYANVDYPDEDGSGSTGVEGFAATSDENVTNRNAGYPPTTTTLVTLATTNSGSGSQQPAAALVTTSGSTLGLLIPVSAHGPGSFLPHHQSYDEEEVQFLKEECILGSPSDPNAASGPVVAAYSGPQTHPGAHHPQLAHLAATNSPANSSIESSSTISSSETTSSSHRSSAISTSTSERNVSKTSSNEQHPASQESSAPTVIKSNQQPTTMTTVAKKCSDKNADQGTGAPIREPLYENTVKYSEQPETGKTSMSTTTSTAASHPNHDLNANNHHFYSNLTETLNPHHPPLTNSTSGKGHPQQAKSSAPNQAQQSAGPEQSGGTALTRSHSAGQVKVANRVLMAQSAGPNQAQARDNSPSTANMNPGQRPQQSQQQQPMQMQMLSVHPSQMVPMVVSSPMHRQTGPAHNPNVPSSGITHQQMQQQQAQLQAAKQHQHAQAPQQVQHSQQQQQAHHAQQAQQPNPQARIQMVCNPQVYQIAAHPGLYATIPRRVASQLNVGNETGQNVGNFPKASEIRRRDGLNAFPFVAESPPQNGFLVPPLNPDNNNEKTTPTSDDSNMSQHQQTRERTKDELEAFVRQDLERIERIRKRYSVSGEGGPGDQDDPSFGFARRPSVRGIKSKYDNPTAMMRPTTGTASVRVLSAVPISGPVRIIPASQVAALQHHLGSTPNLRISGPAQHGQPGQGQPSAASGQQIRHAPPPYQLHYVRLTPQQVQNLQAQQALKIAAAQQQQQLIQNRSPNEMPNSVSAQQSQQQQRQVSGNGLVPMQEQNNGGRPTSMVHIPYVYPAGPASADGSNGQQPQQLNQARIMTTQQIQQLRLQQAGIVPIQGQGPGGQVMGSQAQLYRVTSMNSVASSGKIPTPQQQNQMNMMGMNMAMVQPQIITRLKAETGAAQPDTSPSPKHSSSIDSASSCSSSSGSGPSTGSHPSTAGSGGPHHAQHQQQAQLSNAQLNNLNKPVPPQKPGPGPPHPQHQQAHHSMTASFHHPGQLQQIHPQQQMQHSIHGTLPRGGHVGGMVLSHARAGPQPQQGQSQQPPQQSHQQQQQAQTPQSGPDAGVVFYTMNV